MANYVGNREKFIFERLKEPAFRYSGFRLFVLIRYACFQGRFAGIAALALFFLSALPADRAWSFPSYLSAPSFPPLHSFGAPEPPAATDARGIMPNIAQWRDSFVVHTRSASVAAKNAMQEFFSGPRQGALAWPVHGKISSGFGPRGRKGRRSVHEGIDIPVPRGTPVQAAGAGIVTEARVYNGYGKTVIVDHGAGTKTLYAHCSSFTVKPGDSVQLGQVIAYAGSTGRSTTSHLHFGVVASGAFRDPLVFLGQPPQQLVRKP
jgi:murein DD-endopeptidase MepM/ murein hydrolase activator NlpD